MYIVCASPLLQVCNHLSNVQPPNLWQSVVKSHGWNVETRGGRGAAERSILPADDRPVSEPSLTQAPSLLLAGLDVIQGGRGEVA